MGIYETFSKRQAKREQAGQLDVYQYDDLPDALRAQIYSFCGTLLVGTMRGSWDVIITVLACGQSYTIKCVGN
jgi:hypothetical protein